MTIETILIILFLAEIFLILVGRELLLKLADKVKKSFDEIVKELDKNN